MGGRLVRHLGSCSRARPSPSGRSSNDRPGNEEARVRSPDARGRRSRETHCRPRPLVCVGTCPKNKSRSERTVNSIAEKAFRRQHIIGGFRSRHTSESAMATHAATLLASLAPHRRRSTPNPSANAASASTTTRRSIAPHRRSSIVANGIGFQLNDKDDDSSRGDLEATALIEDASSILYLQEPLRHPCAQAYLALLQQISLKAGPNKLFVAYGEFFRSLRRSGRSTFADVILDEVIVGRGNPVASDIANGSTPNDVDIAAVGADLELLQRICVSEATVLKWCVYFQEFYFRTCTGNQTDDVVFCHSQVPTTRVVGVAGEEATGLVGRRRGRPRG